MDELISLVGIRSQDNPDFFWVEDARKIGGDYRGEGRPFVFGTEPLDLDYDLDIVRIALGWAPAEKVTLAAMCNQRLDHRLLGEMAAWLADRWNGVVDLGPFVPIDQAPGVVMIPYETIEGTIVDSVVVDARALRDWLSQPRFHMVK